MFNRKGGSLLKATGIVRRIDDLGRLVIPKPVRETMRLRIGDPMELLVGPPAFHGLGRSPHYFPIKRHRPGPRHGKNTHFDQKTPALRHLI